MTTPLRAASSVTLGATGGGQVIVGPVPAWRRWRVRHISVAVAAGARPQFRLYRNDVAQTTFLDGTNNGADNASETALDLAAGEYVTGVWSGGTPGQVATMRLEGDIEEGW